MKEAKKDIYWMRKAISLTKNAKVKGEIPVGAILVHEDKLIAEGWNQSIANHDPSAHAEIIALRAAGEYLKNYRLVNTVIYVTQEPCIMCAGAMLHARIARLVYGSYAQKNSLAGSLMHILNNPNINHRILAIGGVLANECSAILTSFFKERRIKKKILKKLSYY